MHARANTCAPVIGKSTVGNGAFFAASNSFGIAIDLNPSLGAYWKWERDQDRLGDMKRRLAYPGKIVRIFEKHGFIWGGKWYHYDLMHFEYRPEFF